jgi:hypothetical protein
MRITDFLPRGVFPASAALLLACGGPSQQAARTPVSLVQATDAVLEFPESVVWDADNSAWYVSNFGGTTFADDSGAAPMKADGNGFITKLASNGEIETLRWITGLDAPKGLGVYRGKLYAADVGRIVVMNLGSATIESRIEVPDSKFLNDVAANPSTGDIYISDWTANRILRLSAGGNKIEVFFESADLEMPNGLYVDGNTLVVGAWGMITDPATFATAVKGRVKLVDLETKAITNVGTGPMANIDGIVKYGDDYFITDWAAGELIQVSAGGSAAVLKGGYKNSADLGFDATRKAIAVPEMAASGGQGRVSFFVLK